MSSLVSFSYVLVSVVVLVTALCEMREGGGELGGGGYNSDIERMIMRGRRIDVGGEGGSIIPMFSAVLFCVSHPFAALFAGT